MDFREPQSHPPNMAMVAPNSFPNTFTPSMMMAPATAQFPLLNNNNLPTHSNPYSNNNRTDINNNTLKPSVVASESFKKKRGRPIKYLPLDDNIALGLASTHVSPSSSSPVKKGRGRGRPFGSGKKKLDVLGGHVAANFTPHVIFVEPGEDVATKVMAFCQQACRTVIILSANGTIRNVTLRHTMGAEGVVTHEGLYELISMSGSIPLPEYNSGRAGMSELSVSLGGLDGIVIVGGIVGELTATSTVQVVVGSFLMDGKKPTSNNLNFRPSSASSSQMLNFGAFVTPISPTSQGPSNESSNDNENGTFSDGSGLYNKTSQPIHTLPMYHHQLWDAQTQQW